MTAKLARLLEILRTVVWGLPALAVVLGFACALGLSFAPASALPALDFAEGAPRAILTTLAATSMTVLSLVFTSTVVGLQLASTQFSPRLLRHVLSDATLRLTLAYLVGTAAFALGSLAPTRGAAGPNALVGLLLTAGVLALVPYFLQHLVSLLRVDSLMRQVTRAGFRPPRPWRSRREPRAWPRRVESSPPRRFGR